MNKKLWTPRPKWQYLSEEKLFEHIESCGQIAEGIEKASEGSEFKDLSREELFEKAKEGSRAFLEFNEPKYNPKRFNLPNTPEMRLGLLHLSFIAKSDNMEEAKIAFSHWWMALQFGDLAIEEINHRIESIPPSKELFRYLIREDDRDFETALKWYRNAFLNTSLFRRLTSLEHPDTLMGEVEWKLGRGIVKIRDCGVDKEIFYRTISGQMAKGLFTAGLNGLRDFGRKVSRLNALFESIDDVDKQKLEVASKEEACIELGMIDDLEKIDFTPQELKTIELLKQGYLKTKIASEFKVSPPRITKIIKNIRKKIEDMQTD
jgi:hypothetical protein